MRCNICLINNRYIKIAQCSKSTKSIQNSYHYWVYITVYTKCLATNKVSFLEKVQYKAWLGIEERYNNLWLLEMCNKVTKHSQTNILTFSGCSVSLRSSEDAGYFIIIRKPLKQFIIIINSIIVACYYVNN